MGYAIVIPTVGRDSLSTVVSVLGEGSGPLPDEVLVVNDRPGQPPPLRVPPGLVGRLRVLDGPGRGPAAARNVGWRAASMPWVVFVDDDVVPGSTWRRQLAHDLAQAGVAVAVAGRISVPLPVGRRPTDWERQVAGLAAASWITADIAYRRDVLEEVGGFDERFPRAYREDIELALRVTSRGYALAYGTRQSSHPVRPAGRWVSVERQRGNADDALLRRLYGREWRRLTGVPRGRRPWHALATASGVLGLASLAAGRRRAAAIAALVWLGATAEFAARRIAPGPRTAGEVGVMLLTSAAIPPVATLHWLRGWLSHPSVRPVKTLAGLPSVDGDLR
jgi:GT2 family glycosyltransferase